ncbi:ABC transporter ATP-binding protein [Mycoplasmatota bacterium]|nr:ABC transporter ATP-binding protein [Mycoplasmatota bacterium]
MKFKIKPYIGAGKIMFGMTSEQIQNILLAEPRKFKKFKDDELYTDAYNTCHIFYKKPGVCEAIEFFNPAVVTFNDINLMNMSYQEIKDLFFKLDKNIQVDDTGFTSYKYGIGVYAPFADECPLDPIEGIIIFEKGYYDRMLY